MSDKPQPDKESNPSHDLARAWFQKAENDLLSAQNNLSSEVVPHDVVCFHCQQAAEKYLKGFLIWHDVAFERIHDLELLVRQCADVDVSMSELRREANVLNDYAVKIRYPDFPDEPTLEDCKLAMEAALNIRASVLSRLQ